MASSSLKLPPGPTGPLASVLNVLQQERDPLGIFVRGQRKYGDIVQYSMGPVRLVLLSHPDYVKHILTDNVQNYPKPGHGVRGMLLGRGLFRSDGDYWKRQRRLVQPAFSRERISGMGLSTAVASTQKMLERWEAHARSGEAFDVAPEMSELTRAMVCRLVFTEDLVTIPGPFRDALWRVMYLHTHQVKAMYARFPIPLPSVKRWRRDFQEAIQQFDSSIYALIEKRRRSSGNEDDMLSIMMAAREPDSGQGMSDEQLRDEAVNIVAAGHEATATTMTWVWAMLGRYPDVERRVREEVATVLGDRTLTAQDLPRLRYTSMVLDEVLRLYPAAWTLAREVVADDRIGGYDIPARSLVTVLSYIMHQHPSFWENPEVFDPERFTPERSAGRPRFCYIPFGGGQRLCIGDRLAQLQILVSLTMTLQRYQVSLASDAPVRVEATSTLRPLGGLRVRLSPYRASLRPSVLSGTGT